MVVTKKYKLFAADGEKGDRPPCAFFQSEKGCRNGSSCKFAHVLANSGNVQVDAGSVVSSESENSFEEEVAPKVVTAEVKVVKVKEEPDVDPSTSSKKRKDKLRNADPFASGNPKKKVAKTATNTPPKTPTTPRPPATPPAEISAKKKKSPKTQDFRSLDLPIASFTKGMTTPSTPAVATKDILPSHPSAKRWLPAIEATRKHARYARAYETEMEGSGLFQARPFGKWCADHPQIIAIDCEMCETKDPNSEKRNPKALCRISVVNCKDGEVLLDSLVQPEWPVVDHRKRINGIGEEELKNVEFTLEHAQSFLKALCSQETVIIGQAVNNDLMALGMIHYCVVDTAFLYVSSDPDSDSCVGLNDIIRSITGKDMSNIHDSVSDAKCANEAVEHWLQKKGKVEPVVRLRSHNQRACNLFCHRIPKLIASSHIENLFLIHSSINPKEVPEIDFNGNHGKVTVEFSTPAHANLAFDTLESKAELDTGGRFQKRVFLKSGGYIFVRKMVYDRKKEEKPQTPES